MSLKVFAAPAALVWSVTGLSPCVGYSTRRQQWVTDEVVLGVASSAPPCAQFTVSSRSRCDGWVKTDPRTPPRSPPLRVGARPHRRRSPRWSAESAPDSVEPRARACPGRISSVPQGGPAGGARDVHSARHTLPPISSAPPPIALAVLNRRARLRPWRIPQVLDRAQGRDRTWDLLRQAPRYSRAPCCCFWASGWSLVEAPCPSAGRSSPLD